jgi:KDO2-lipid IV(A) lauroyltransferase
MQAIGYYIALPFLYLVSVLPYWLFYGFSDVVFFLLYYVIGYRKKVVMENLRNSFPEKSEAERQLIMRRFYRYLCDLFLETFQTLTMSRDFSLRRCVLDEKAKALFDRYHDEKKSVIIVMGHYGNWEWAGNTFSLVCKQQLYVIYHPLTSKYFNRLIIGMRTRFGTRLIPMKDTFRDMIRNRSEVSATAFIADQTPSPDNAYWTTFLNQDTPVFRGTEMIARKMNFPVVYVSVKRKSRGHYHIFAETLFEEPALTGDGEISEGHTRKLESEIRQQPEIWLWSHRRWKHRKSQA